MKYKVGDRVKIKSLAWYNANKDEYGNIDINYDFTFYADRSKYCGKVFTISEVFDNSYLVKEDNGDYYWTDEMIEGIVEEEVGLIDGFSSRWINEFNLPEGYIFKDENGNVINATKIVLEKKKKEYPKTFEKCVRVLEGENRMSLEQMNTFRKLIDARNAYWKIAGDEMGLGKPWEPDSKEPAYAICRIVGTIKTMATVGENYIFEFPTAEMRDAFKENFDPDIEFCKELL